MSKFIIFSFVAILTSTNVYAGGGGGYTETNCDGCWTKKEVIKDQKKLQQASQQKPDLSKLDAKSKIGVKK